MLLAEENCLSSHDIFELRLEITSSEELDTSASPYSYQRCASQTAAEFISCVNSLIKSFKPNNFSG